LLDCELEDGCRKWKFLEICGSTSLSVLLTMFRIVEKARNTIAPAETTVTEMLIIVIWFLKIIQYEDQVSVQVNIR